MATPLIPPIHNAQPPPLEKLEWPQFERLTVDLFQYEDGISSSELHGMPGPQTDYGVDVIAWRRDGDGVEVASCKRYPAASPTQLVRWSKEFLDHWATRWSGMSVRRFVLATTATNLASIPVINQVATERRRFAELGIAYEVWGPRQFVQRLRPHRQLTAAYLQEHWADAICGAVTRTEPAVARTPSPLNEAIVSQLADLQAQLSGNVAKRADAALDALRAGRGETVQALVVEMRDASVWPQLTREVQATVLRLAGSSALQEHDLDLAQRYDDEAGALSPADEPRLAARIALARSGPAIALALLGQPSSIPGRQLRAALLLGEGEREEARALLDGLLAEAPDEGETIRLDALEKLGRNDRAGALESIVRAERSCGHWITIMRAGAIIRYAMSLSASVGPSFLLQPNPVVATLVREDTSASAHLEHALALFDQIEERGSSVDDDKVWRIAVLANLRGRRADASAAAREVLRQVPGEPTTLAWALQRDLDVDAAESIEALERAYGQGAEMTQVRVLGLAYATTGRATEGAAFLEAHAAAQIGEAAAEAADWTARLRNRSADAGSEALRRAQQDGDWSDALPLLDGLLSSTPPDPFGLIVAELAASAGRWDALSPHIAALLGYGTATGVRLAALAASATNDHGRVIAILEAHADAFGGALPDDMRRVRVEALSHTGGDRDALREARHLAAATDTLADHLLREELRARYGSVREAVPVVRRALEEEAIGTTSALIWSHRLRQVAPDLSRDLLRMAVERGVSPEHELAAMDQALQLGLEREASILIPRVQARAEGGAEDVRVVTIEEAREMILGHQQDEDEVRKLYLDGAIPVHLAVRGRADMLLRMQQANAATERNGDARLQPRLMRHGGRPRRLDHEQPWREWHIHLDVTGLLEAHRFGLLPRIESHPNGILISPNLPAVLQQMRDSVGTPQPRRVAGLRRLVSLIGGGTIEVAFPPFGEAQVVLEESKGFGEDSGAQRHSPADLVAALVKAGLINATEASALEDGAGTGVTRSAHSIDIVRPVIVPLEFLERLDAADVLDRITHDVRMLVTRRDALACRSAITTLEASEHLCRLASDLAQRVGDGIEIGVYRILPAGAQEEEVEGSRIELQLADLLRAPAVTGGIVWFDDRNLTGYAQTGAMPIVGVVEVVYAIQRAGLLDRAEADRLLADVRASGAACLPFEVDEIMGPLLAAPVSRSGLIETSALANLRRSFAMSGSLEPHLKLGPAPDLLNDRPDEDQIVRSTMRLFGEALERLWLEPDMQIDERFARSDWLWHSVRSIRPNRPIPVDDPAAAQDRFMAMQVAHSLDKASEIGDVGDERRDLRLNFLHWCWERMVSPHLVSDPKFVDKVADYLVTFYRALGGDVPVRRTRHRTIIERLLFRRVQRLPPPIGRLVRQSGMFPQSVKVFPRLTIAHDHFDPQRFWNAVRTAMRYGRSSARTLNGKRVRMRREDDLVVLTGAVKAVVGDDLPVVLAAKGAYRATLIDRFVARLDPPPDEAAALRGRLAATGSDAELAEQLDGLRRGSVVGRHARAEESLASRRGTEIADLLPASLGQLLHHVRMAAADEPAANMRRASGELVAGFGVVEAFRRLSGIPRPDVLAGTDRPTAAELTRIDELARTPFAIAAAIRLRRTVTGDVAVLVPMLERLVDAALLWGGALTTALKWTHARLVTDPAWGTLDPGLRAAATWSHADWLVDAFARLAFKPETLHDGLKEGAAQMSSIDHMSVRAAGPIDQADPESLSAEVLLFHCLAAACGDEDVADVLPADLLDRVRSALSMKNGETTMPRADIILRRPEGPDALEGHLSTDPRGLFDAPVTRLRDGLIDNAIEAVSRQPDDPAAWNAFAAISHRGLSREQFDRYEKLLPDLDVQGLPFMASGVHDSGASMYLWRAALGPMAWHRSGEIGDLIAVIADRCAVRFPGRVQGSPSAEAALAELVEVAVAAGAWKPGNSDDAITARHLVAVADSWPASTPSLRRLLNGILAQAAPSRAPALWDLDNDLRRRP